MNVCKEALNLTEETNKCDCARIKPDSESPSNDMLHECPEGRTYVTSTA